MNDCHWYPFDPMVWLTDTLHMDAVTETAYARIQHYYYATGRPVPNDQHKLQNIGKVKDQDWMRVYGELLLAGFYVDGVVLRHKRIDATLADMEAKRLEQNNRTKAATEARARKRNETPNEERNEQRDVGRYENDDVQREKGASGDVTSTHLHLQPHLNAKLIKGGKALSGENKEIAERFEKSLGSRWLNDAGKWINRIKANSRKTHRVIAEVDAAIREHRIKTTPAQYAEQIWKEFK